MRRLSTPQVVLAVMGALCGVGFVARWLARDARAVDAVHAPLGLDQATDADARASAALHGGQGVLVAPSSELPTAARRALAPNDTLTLLQLHPDRSQLDFVVTAFGAPVAGAAIVLFPPSDLAPPLFFPAPGLTLTEGGGVVTAPDGRASIAVAPKVEWRGIVRWTAPDTKASLSAEFSGVSPTAGFPRLIPIDLGSTKAARFLHVEVRSEPSGRKLYGAELYAIMDDGSVAPSELGPTRAISGADGCALVWWPMGTRLCVDADGHTPFELTSAYSDRIRAGVVHTTLEAAAAAAPTALELSALGALHGQLDPRWAAGGRVFVRGPQGGSIGGRQVRGGVASRSYGDASALVTVTGHWRIDGLPTYIPPDPERAFAVDPRRGFTVQFEGPVSGDAPRVVRARLHSDVSLGSAAELELPDPFGECAPVALTARGPGEFDVEGVRVELHLMHLPSGEGASSKVVRLRAGSLGSNREVMSVDSRLVAEGRITTAGRVVAPVLPLGRYELRVPEVVIEENRLEGLEAEPMVDGIEILELELSARFCRAWGRFEHDGRAVETVLASGPPEGDD